MATGSTKKQVQARFTPKEDKHPITVQVRGFKGTVYWGGAGLDGAYIQDQMDALYENGIKYLFQGTSSSGTIMDAVLSGSMMRYESDRDFRLDESKLYNNAPQFNFIGYSYGSLLAAQTAIDYANKGVFVDHIVLVASPIDRDFLMSLKSNQNIGKVHTINIRQFGDPIYAGMTQFELTTSALTLGKQMAESQSKGEGIGHFYYAANSADGRKRRRTLAREIQALGLQ